MGLSHTISVGPSELLQYSGSGKAIPRMGDYHHNLTKLSKYIVPGPASYSIPSFLDNYKKDFSTIPNLKKNPRINFDRKDPPTRFHDYSMLHENLNVESPGPMADYKDIAKPTFDRIAAMTGFNQKEGAPIGSRMNFKAEEAEVGTFGTDKRFHVAKKD